MTKSIAMAALLLLLLLLAFSFSSRDEEAVPNETRKSFPDIYRQVQEWEKEEEEKPFVKEEEKTARVESPQTLSPRKSPTPSPSPLRSPPISSPLRSPSPKDLVNRNNAQDSKKLGEKEKEPKEEMLSPSPPASPSPPSLLTENLFPNELVLSNISSPRYTSVILKYCNQTSSRVGAFIVCPLFLTSLHSTRLLHRAKLSRETLASQRYLLSMI